MQIKKWSKSRGKWCLSSLLRAGSNQSPPFFWFDSFVNKCPQYPCSRWPRGLRRRSAAARLLALQVRILQRAWMSVYSECCVLSGRGLCDELITRPEESYRVWCVWVWSRNLKNAETMARFELQRHCKITIHHSFSILSYDRSKASSKTSSPHSAI